MSLLNQYLVLNLMPECRKSHFRAFRLQIFLREHAPTAPEVLQPPTSELIETLGVQRVDMGQITTARLQKLTFRARHPFVIRSNEGLTR